MREARVGQFEACRYYGGVVDDRTYWAGEKVAVSREVLGVELVEVIASLELDTVVGVEAGAEQGALREAMFDRKVIVDVVTGLTGLRCLVSGTAVQTQAGVLLRRALAIDEGSQTWGLQTLALCERDAVGQEVTDGTESTAEALNAIVGIAIFADDVPHDGTARTDDGFRADLISEAQAGSEAVLAGVEEDLAIFACELECAQDAVGRWVGDGGIEVAVLQVCFAPGRTVVVAQP